MLGLVFALLLTSGSTLTPEWKPGQEILYRGTIKEIGQGFLNHFALEFRVLVVSIQASSVELAFCTKLTQQNKSRLDQTITVYLTHAHIDRRGRITASTANPGLNLVIDGPATWENGFLLPLPDVSSQIKKPWESTEPGRLPRRFTWSSNAEDKTIILGEQESLDWQRPRGDSTAWHRSDKLTFTAQSSLPVKVERTIERRAPAHQQVTGRIVTEYELVREETLTGPMLQARLADIQQLRRFQDEIATLSQQPLDRQTQASWKKLSGKLTQFQLSSGNTPYRESLTTMISTIEAAMENRLSLQQTKLDASEPSIKIGELTPPFALRTGTGETITSQQCKGRPCLLVFLQPGSELTRSLYLELPVWQQSYGQTSFHCLLAGVGDKTTQLPPITAASASHMLRTVQGRSLAGSFGVSETPFFVLLDPNGTLLAVHEGWGPETKQNLQRILRQELAKVRK